MKKKNQKKIINNINLKIFEGETLGLIGQSGSGKTTLLNCLSALDSPSGGEYTFLDSEVPRNNSEKMTSFRRENIGYVFQFFNLLEVPIPGLNVFVGSRSL